MKQFSLEEQMVEPFRAIRSFEIRGLDAVIATLFFIASIVAWWFLRVALSEYWMSFANVWISKMGLSWSIQSGSWPNPGFALFNSPQIVASVMAPDRYQWWFAILLNVGAWVALGQLPERATPIRVTLRYWLVLFMIALVWFSFSPLHFHHSVEEWSDIYFLVSYATLPIYFFLWAFGILLFPISNWVKLLGTLLWLGFVLIGIPLLILVSVVFVDKVSLMVLPLLTLGIVPLFQLGWFIAFYSVTLSAGVRRP